MSTIRTVTAATQTRLLLSSILACARLPGRLGSVIHGLLAGFYLGFLDETGIARLDEEFYSLDGTYRSEEFNERGLFTTEQRVLSGALSPGARVIVLGCGGGREVLGLLRAGYDAVGFESHPLLCAWGARFVASRGFADRVRPVARDGFPPGLRCDGVLVGWGTYSLIAPRARRMAFLADARTALAPGAPLILSVLQAPSSGRPVRGTAALANLIRRLRSTDPVEIGDTLAPNRVHVFAAGEASAELSTAGLEPVTAEVAGPAGQDTWHTYLVARVPV